MRCNTITFMAHRRNNFHSIGFQKRFLRTPKFKDLSTDAKVLYGILLDRMSLSLKNHWLDEQNRVYIIFTLEEIMESLN